MAADQFVNVTYRGLDIGKRLRISQFGPMSAYLEHSTPMPVGTELAIHTDEGVRVPVRVLRVQEQVAGAENPPGMRVAAARLDDAAGAWWQGLVTTSDPQIPEPLLGAAEQDTEIQAEADSARADSAGAEADSADAELQTGVNSDELPADAGFQAEGEPGDGDDAIQDAPASREAAPTEQMAAVDIQAIMASASSTSAEPAEDEDESPEEDGRISSDDSEDSPSGGKKRRRGRRRKGRG